MLTIPIDRVIFKLPIQVMPEDIDELNHVNNVIYLRWIQAVAYEHWDLKASDDMKENCRWVVLRHEIDYHSPALPGDRIEATTWIDAPEGPRQNRYVSVRRMGDGKALASASTSWCLLDSHTGRPKRVSKEIASVLGLKY